MRNPIPRMGAALAGGVLVLALGCQHPQSTVRRSGLMEYLYPKSQTAPVPNPTGARLQIPLKLGVAFVPSTNASWRVGSLMAPGQERQLLELVKNSFKDKPWVGEIKLVPGSYLRSGGGFENLDQVARMYGVDVMALVSVDQIQYTDPRWYSFAYLSIVGAYVLPGDANDTRTLIDAAVFHVPTRTFLFRAPGQSTVKGVSTLIAREEVLREHSAKGFGLAMAELTKNLDSEVGAFKAEIAKGDRKDVDLIDKEGRSLRQTGGTNWGGALGWMEVAAGLALVAFWKRRMR